MSHDGKRLEALVAYVEETLVPQGFKVIANDRVFEDGIQIAEFDVVVQGKIGTSDFQWLIECRDRPSSGAAPGSWVEQLLGRRTRFNFNKVTAVSTTGFAAGVHEFAQTHGIELREVKALTPEHFSDWLAVEFIVNQVRHTTLTSAYMGLASDVSAELRSASAKMLPSINAQTPILRSSVTGELVSLAQAFSGAASQNQELFDGLETNGEARTVKVCNQYPEDDHFWLDTPAGSIPVKEILFTGELRLKETQLPVVSSNEYRDTLTGKTISQVVTYAPQSIMGQPFSLELHNLAETGETHVILRKLGSES